MAIYTYTGNSSEEFRSLLWTLTDNSSTSPIKERARIHMISWYHDSMISAFSFYSLSFLHAQPLIVESDTPRSYKIYQYRYPTRQLKLFVLQMSLKKRVGIRMQIFKERGIHSVPQYSSLSSLYSKVYVKATSSSKRAFLLRARYIFVYEQRFVTFRQSFSFNSGRAS